LLLYKLRRLAAMLVFRARFIDVLAGVLFYAAVSYLLLYFAGEETLIAAENFAYWLVVTASTVGYGDLSPSTVAGKAVVSLWVVPFGLMMFAMVLARVGFYFSELAVQGKKGLRMIRTDGNCVIIGWNGPRTLRLIDLLLSASNGVAEPIVLCVAVDIDNPMPGKIELTRVESFTHAETMKRPRLDKANRIIIDTPSDDVTLATALFCQNVSPASHKTVYFQDESLGALLKLHCPGVEVIPSVSVEMLARSTSDPGSGLLHKQLLDSTYGTTSYCITFEGDAELHFDELFQYFRSNLSATLLGVKPLGRDEIALNPYGISVAKGDVLYYIAPHRLSEAQCFNTTAA
jgi:voltage-gated potassium channel